jgi:DNA-binding transcriptional MerR regulator
MKVLRRQQDTGLIYSPRRSSTGYRLFDQRTLWCVRIVRGLRELGLAEAEIQQLATTCDDNPGLVGPPLAALLQRSGACIDARVPELKQQRSASTTSNTATTKHSPGKVRAARSVRRDGEPDKSNGAAWLSHRWQTQCWITGRPTPAERRS